MTQCRVELARWAYELTRTLKLPDSEAQTHLGSPKTSRWVLGALENKHLESFGHIRLPYCPENGSICWTHGPHDLAALGRRCNACVLATTSRQHVARPGCSWVTQSPRTSSGRAA